ncbi:hypothetical protein CGLO_16180 [Colletotrichum gloeosporioides Cg-14]|uniref:Uncharacterized protein n=1 Tax=Colletotrichum gloeosporioides (strain Cg-14) TaxID=1237896 RepID=T0JZV3_COLGC|nr:hypothetical protein CGLO_16180 [Colletotrichum gloeosporioides Cg-14]
MRDETDTSWITIGLYSNRQPSFYDDQGGLVADVIEKRPLKDAKVRIPLRYGARTTS